MKRHVKQTMVSLSLVAAMTGMAAPAWASDNGTNDLKVMPISAPVLISAGAGWQGHWAKQDLEILRASVNLKPDVLVSAAVDPNDAITLESVADMLTCIHGAGGEQGDALERAVKLGLIRSSDYEDGQIHAQQPVAREVFALLLTRALRVNGAEDPVANQTAAPKFTDAADIHPTYRAAVALMQAEGLLIGDEEGRFSPAQPLTFAQATRTMVKVSAWTQQRVAKMTGVNPAAASYLIEGQQVTLTDGMARQPAAPGSASEAVTKLMDRQAAGDLNGDGQLDVAAVLVRSSGGSGTFFYLSVVQQDGTSVKAVFLGDRIVVQNVRIVAGRVAVDMLTRSATDPMVARPSIKGTRLFELRDGMLVPSAS